MALPLMIVLGALFLAFTPRAHRAVWLALVGCSNLGTIHMHPLEQAARLIEIHIDTLDTSRDVCSCCGVAKYEDFTAYNDHKTLTSMVTKLRGMAKRPT